MTEVIWSDEDSPLVVSYDPKVVIKGDLHVTCGGCDATAINPRGWRIVHEVTESRLTDPLCLCPDCAERVLARVRT